MDLREAPKVEVLSRPGPRDPAPSGGCPCQLRWWRTGETRSGGKSSSPSGLQSKPTRGPSSEQILSTDSIVINSILSFGFLQRLCKVFPQLRNQALCQLLFLVSWDIIAYRSTPADVLVYPNFQKDRN